MTELTRQDLDVLLEAVEAWERDDQFGDIMVEMLGGLACRDNPAEKAKLEMEMKQRRTERESKRKLKKERGIMLRAKLIEIRNSADASTFIRNAIGQ